LKRADDRLVMREYDVTAAGVRQVKQAADMLLRAKKARYEGRGEEAQRLRDTVTDMNFELR